MVDWNVVGPELLEQLKLAQAAIETPGDLDDKDRKYLLEDIQIVIAKAGAGTEDADC